MVEGRVRCHFICRPGAQSRTPALDPVARFETGLTALMPGVRLVATGPHEIELARGPWSIQAGPSFLRLGYEGLRIDWGEFQQLARAALDTYLDSFGPEQVEAATLGCTLSLRPSAADILGRVFRVYPVLSHPLAAQVGGFRLAATFHTRQSDELFQVYLAGRGGAGSEGIGVIFELDYTRHFRRLVAGEVGNWLRTAPVVFRELLLGSLREPDSLGL